MTQVAFSVDKEIHISDSSGESVTIVSDGTMIIIDENKNQTSGKQVTKEEATAIAIALG